MTEHHDLELILRSHIPLVVIETHEETRAHALVSAAATRLFRPVYSWSITEGMRRIDIDYAPQGDLSEPVALLRHVKTGMNAGIYILNDFHPYLDDPLHVRFLKDIALTGEKNQQTLVLVSHEVPLPAELKRYAATVTLALPGSARVRELVQEIAGEWRRRSTQAVRTSPRALELLVQNLSGLSERDVRQLARNAIFDDGAITEADLPQVASAKYALLAQQGVLSFEYDTARLADVAGMNRLKAWLAQRRHAFAATATESAPLDPPKGILLLGVQGGGKSLAAKAVAGAWGVPLLRLDVGSLYNKFHGQTERNLRDSLATADAMAPCVLWVDELEKGLATGDNDGGTSRRVLGTLLTWMAERKSQVFLVATANEIDRLPPELVRKGRFDEIFFVDLPSPAVRREIFAIHLQRRALDPAGFDLERLATAADGFSGAEIEQAVVAGLYSARARDTSAATEDILQEISRTRPLSVTLRERMDALRAWASERTVSAD